MRVRDLVAESSKVTLAMVLVAVVCPVAAAGTMLATQLFVALPATIPEPEPPEAIRYSQVYDIDGNLIHTYQSFDQNIPVNREDIPETIKLAVVAAEDRNFYDHEGFDLRGTMRALITDVRQGELAQGGSTITQQLAKLAYGAGTERTFGRKIREAVLAAQLDRTLDKDEILFQYLSIAYWGEGAYGIGAAAQVYFNKPVQDLDYSEAAILAGLLPAPSSYNPRANPEVSEQRRRQVLNAMHEEGMITADHLDRVLRREVWLASQGQPTGPATRVVRPPSTAKRYPWFIDYLTRELGRELELGDRVDDYLASAGLQIFTTLDPRVQAEAEATVTETVADEEPRFSTGADGNEVRHDLQMSITAVEPPTGFVRAMVGGRNYDDDDGLALPTQANIAVPGLGSSGRQPGSSFKPFTLATAFEQGITPDAIYDGGPVTFGEYSPENYGGAVYGEMTLREATRRSVNTVFVRLFEEVGPYEVIDTAQELGLRTPEFDPSVEGLSTALGTRDVFTLDMASAYGVFGNRGQRVPPTPIVRVFSSSGELLVDHSARDGEQVIEQATADNVTQVLEGVLQSGGTAGDNAIGRPAAGKTGTTQDNNDGWFVGYTPTLSTAVFLGWDSRVPGDSGVSTSIDGISLTGGGHPAAAWERFMVAALDGVPATGFSEPAPIEEVVSAEVQRERRGFAPGAPSSPVETGSGGPYVSEPEPPVAPTATSSTTTTSTTTTSTTTTSTTTSTTEPENCGLFGCD